MSKFKVGDKVRIKDDMIIGVNGFYSSMKEYCNSITYVIENFESSDEWFLLEIDDELYSWHRDWLELYKEEPNEEHELLEYALELLNISREELENKKKKQDNKYKIKPLLDKISNVGLCDDMYCNNCKYFSSSHGSLSCNDLKLIDYLYENNYLKLGDDK